MTAALLPFRCCPQVQMERSLFERLQQQGAPVKMLSVQYRMHPAIRQVRRGAGAAVVGSCVWASWW